ncbi:MAG TPA: hypothetical protein VLL25_00600 [Acidimicrobiales bacterium]|jgi:hypothetical protein|nr:hypothetical protein [Acidimicrobiales bacterium]
MLLLPTLTWLRARWETTRADERGMTTETVILIAIFAGLAIAAGAIIVAKVIGKAKSIPTS